MHTCNFLQDAGLLILSDFDIETRPCKQSEPPFFELKVDALAQAAPVPSPLAPGSAPIDSPSRIVRDYFPETWLWDLYNMNSENLTIPTTIPDTITQWDASAFCISAQDGIGIPPPQPITAFQPYFMDYTLPFSVKQGELIKLKLSIFNYLQEQLPVSLILSKD